MNPLSEFDWNFDAVPDDELVACCYWEYARESRRIRSVYDEFDVTFFPPSMHAVGENGNGGRILDNTRSLFIAQLWEHALPIKLTRDKALATVSAPFENSWFSLPPAIRRSVVEELGPYSSAQPALTFLPFNRCSDMRDLGIAEEGYRCEEFDEELGVEFLRVEIDWAGFTDSEILTAMKAWLEENRPEGVGVADRRGQRKQKGLRDNLAWLGIMRLMHFCSFTRIEKELPAAWSIYRSADWPRSRQKAIRTFREMFWFLPQDDLPLHASTAGGRSKQVGRKH